MEGTRVAAALPSSPETQEVPTGTLFVVGDDPDRSLDSRSLGPIEAATVIGVIHR
ncbi:MAG: S26 family signal peptidase [Planctomycetota bacterium]